MISSRFQTKPQKWKNFQKSHRASLQIKSADKLKKSSKIFKRHRDCDCSPQVPRLVLRSSENEKGSAVIPLKQTAHDCSPVTPPPPFFSVPGSWWANSWLHTAIKPLCSWLYIKVAPFLCRNCCVQNNEPSADPLSRSTHGGLTRRVWQSRWFQISVNLVVIQHVQILSVETCCSVRLVFKARPQQPSVEKDGNFEWGAVWNVLRSEVTLFSRIKMIHYFILPK